MTTTRTTSTLIRNILFIGVIVFSAFGLAVTPALAADQTVPYYGAAVVDGNTAEWNLTTDFYADMFRAAIPTKDPDSKLYLRYDCTTNVVYALVLAQPGVNILAEPENAFIKINDLGNSPVVNGNSGNDGTAPDFAWVGLNGGYAAGWEASFPLPAGQYSGLNVHTNVYADGASQTSAVKNRGMPLGLACTDYGDLPASFGITMQANDGARHTIGSLHLGSLIDGEADGHADSNAVGDDISGRNDADGIHRTNTLAWTPGSTVNLLANASGSGGCLVGWFDWNGNNSMSDAGEMVDFGSLADGDNTLSLPVPMTYSSPNPIYARFRLYPCNQPAPGLTGLVANGEVEDYRWEFTPNAVNLVSFSANSVEQPAQLRFGLTVVAVLSAAVLAFVLLVRRRRLGQQ